MQTRLVWEGSSELFERKSWLIKNLGLTKPAALDAQRVGTLPASDLERAFSDARHRDILNTYADLIDRARPGLSGSGCPMELSGGRRAGGTSIARTRCNYKPISTRD